MRRRGHLFIKKNLYDALCGGREERDANGRRFERVPLFGERENGTRRELVGHEGQWTEEEEEALIEGLQDFAGKCLPVATDSHRHAPY